MADFSVQRITSTAKTEITTTNSDFKSIVFTNNHASAALTIDLWVTEQFGNDIEDTSIDVNYAVGYAAGTSSTTVVVGTTDATTVDLVGEKIWKSDGTLFGTCTAIGGATSITFGDGLSQKLTHADSLYMGIDHFFLNDVVIPYRVSLKLEEDEFSFPSNEYKMWITCTTCSTTNTLDITIR